MNDKSFNVAVFAYNFPHKKTQDFLFRLLIGGLFPKLVLAADPIELNIPRPSVRVKPRHYDLIHPLEICKRFGINYHIVEHNSQDCSELLINNSIDIGVISGARILNQQIINSVKKGIINIHPCLLPEGRGLDALQWAIYDGRSLGVTAHVINSRVDQGRILKRIIIPEYPDDTLVDLSIRLEQAQNNVLVESINFLNELPIESFELVSDRYPLHKKMPPELEYQLNSLLGLRLAALKSQGK